MLCQRAGGSGKTELLIQRTLALLARVREPEQVVAITFTRKAAAEMRARLFAALASAAREEPVASAHQQLTRDLSSAVLKRDAAEGWHLLSTPSRLKIMTIDSLCGELTRQMPLLSGLGGALSRVDDASHLYREAVTQLIEDLSADSGADRDNLSRLLLHLDNDWESATELLSALLARRDQWLPLFGAGGLEASPRAALDDLLSELWAAQLAALEDRLAPWREPLEPLLAFRWENLGGPPPDQRALALDLADLLLTGKGEWRARLTKAQGFPPGDGAAKALKLDMQSLLEAMSQSGAGEALREQLLWVRQMPEPAADPEHWSVLVALTRLLPALVARLLLVFRRAGEVDHSQVALAALDALGEDAAPTELALRMDYRIEHLLVDEFQDTSSGQFELIRRLTRDWAEHNAQNPEAPRTLMLVGDAMQSIYGFRDANVGLFIRAREEGVGDLALEALSLEVNFRSDSAVVDWVNDRFPALLAPEDDPELGAVSFRPATAQRRGGDGPEVCLFDEAYGDQSELAWLCGQVQAGLAAGAGSIAILGRSRGVLGPILAALREAGIPYRARDLDSLAQRMITQDLLTLCRVLSNPFDRYAWLCLCRTPWVGLEHADLLCAARIGSAAALRLQAPEDGLLSGLSDDGRRRLQALQRVLRWAEHYRDRTALRVWVEESWLRLGGAAMLASEAEREDAEAFFQTLEVVEQAGEGLSLSRLEEAVARLFAAPGGADARVEVMTLHRAKGLEFDWVFIPGLHGGARQGERDLLLWDEFTLAGEPAFLFDIRAARDAEKGQRIFDLLRLRKREKQRLELMRLLYVGCTRAAQRLFLSGCARRDDDSGAIVARAGSFLAAMVPLLGPAQTLRTADGARTASVSDARSYRRLRELPALPEEPRESASAPILLADNQLARAFGTALHRSMESLAYRDRLPRRCDAALEQQLKRNLVDAGCGIAALDQALVRGITMLDNVLRDDTVHWMLAPARPARAAELPVTAVADGEMQQLIVDYSFVDEKTGERWIVDYKTSEPPPGQDAERFYGEELERYRDQLEAYRGALAEIFPEPLRCAVYFLAAASLRELEGAAA